MTYKVLNRKSGTTMEVNEGESILDAALRQSIVFPYSCRGGTCGTCKASLLSGKVSYPHNEMSAISEEEKQSGAVLLCQAIPEEDIEIDANEMAANAGIEIKMMPCRVSTMNTLAHDVMELSLKIPASQQLPYMAGQYMDIIMRDGRRRSFSLASRPQAGQELKLHIRHVPGGRFSGLVFDSMTVKDLLRFQGPFGTFFLRRESDKPVIMMAGGTGLAPIKAILEQAFHDQLQRPMHLFWGVRQLRDLYHHELLSEWAASYDNFSYTPVLSEPESESGWTGKTGWVHDAVVEAHSQLSSFEIYASGPPVMIDAAKATFPAHGMDPEAMHYDSFDYATDV
ncbi:MAG: CDP-4-dehydro-6-deoxyglucose reductase [Gammaproteobacteria bacterium]|jgi:CDP-4-dehydro-6-deoxyglucose reductase